MTARVQPAAAWSYANASTVKLHDEGLCLRSNRLAPPNSYFVAVFIHIDSSCRLSTQVLLATGNHATLFLLYQINPASTKLPATLSIMAEVGFAKTFLSSLDSRPVKLSANHVEDPKSFPARPPV